MSSPPGRYWGDGWGDGGKRGGGGGIFYRGWGGRVLLVGCDHQRQAPADHVVRERGGAPDFVHRQSGGLSSCAPATCSHSANCAEDLRRSHRWSSWTRLRCPLLYSDRCLGYDSAENCGISAVAVLTRWSMSLSMPFNDGYGRSCDHAATSGLSLEMPQTRFISRVRGHYSCTTEMFTTLSAG